MELCILPLIRLLVPCTNYVTHGGQTSDSSEPPRPHLPCTGASVKNRKELSSEHTKTENFNNKFIQCTFFREWHCHLESIHYITLHCISRALPSLQERRRDSLRHDRDVLMPQVKPQIIVLVKQNLLLCDVISRRIVIPVAWKFNYNVKTVCSI